MAKSVFRLFMGFWLVNLVHIPFIHGATLLPVLTVKAKKVNKTAFSETDSDAANFEVQQQIALTDALKNTPGVHLVQAGGVGKSAQLFVRGTNPEHVLVLIDGVRAHDPSSPNGGFDFGQLETEGLQEIDVLRGPHTASYGSDAVGGVVLLTTKRGCGVAKADFVGEAGSFQSYRQSLSFQGEKPFGDLYVQVGHRQIDNPSSVPYSRRVLPRQNYPDPYDSLNFTSHCALISPQNWRLSLHNRHQRSRSRYVNEFNANPNSQDIITYDLHGLTLEGTDKSQTWQPTLQGGYLQSQRTSGQEYAPFFPPSSYRGKTLSLQWHNHFRLTEVHALEGGVDYQYQSYRTLLPMADGYERTQANTYESSFFIGYRGAPHERVEIDIWERGHQNRQFKFNQTHRASITYHHLETHTDFYTNYGTVIHNPSLFQMFDPISGNRNLRPEKGYGWEVGIQQALGHRLRVGTLFFQTRLRDLIAGQQLAPLIYQYNNINRVQIRGLESFIEWEIRESLKVSLNHLYTSAKDLSTNETLLRRPLHKLLLTMQWQMTADYDIGLNLSYDGKQADRDRFSPYQRTYIRGPLLLRATLTYKPTHSFLGYGHQEFFIRIENVLNRHYEEPAGYMQPGIGFYAGFRLST